MNIAIGVIAIIAILGAIDIAMRVRYKKNWQLTDAQSVRRDLLKAQDHQKWKDESYE